MLNRRKLALPAPFEGVIAAAIGVPIPIPAKKQPRPGFTWNTVNTRNAPLPSEEDLADILSSFPGLPAQQPSTTRVWVSCVVDVLVWHLEIGSKAATMKALYRDYDKNNNRLGYVTGIIRQLIGFIK